MRTKTGMAFSPEMWEKIKDKPLYHVTHRKFLNQILAEGLRPSSELGHRRDEGFFAPRPGYVYMYVSLDMAINSAQYQGENWNETNPDMAMWNDPIVLEIDASQLDPNQFVADEDFAFQSPHLISDKYHPLPKLDDDDNPLGEWADQVGLDDPQVTERSYNEHWTIAYGGTVPPSAISVVPDTPVNDAMYNIDPEERRQYMYGRITHTSNILDPIKKTLDPRVFNGITPKPQIVNFLKRIYYKAFAREFNINPARVPNYIQIVLTGSLTTYQYSDTSDCDNSVFPDYNRIYQDFGLPPEELRARLIAMSIDHLDGSMLPGGSHPAQFFVVNQGLGPEEQFKPGLRSGYDLQTGEWIVPPERDRSHDIQLEFPDVYQRASDMAEKMTIMLDTGDTDHAIEMWKQVHKKRQLDQRAGLGDFCEGNIVYKWLVHAGIVDRLRKELGLQIAASVKEADDQLQFPLTDTELTDLPRQIEGLAAAIPTDYSHEIEWQDWDLQENHASIDHLYRKVTYFLADITDVTSYLGALHELGHIEFRAMAGDMRVPTSQEEELYAWHYALEHCLTPLSRNVLYKAKYFFDSYKYHVTMSPSSIGWIHSAWRPTMPQEIMDRYLQIMECPLCHGNMLRDEQGVYCPHCGWNPEAHPLTAESAEEGTPEWADQKVKDIDSLMSEWGAFPTGAQVKIRSGEHAGQLGYVDQVLHYPEKHGWEYWMHAVIKPGEPPLPYHDPELGTDTHPTRGHYMTWYSQHELEPYLGETPESIYDMQDEYPDRLGKIAATFHILYDFEKDRITLGSKESDASTKIIGEYDDDDKAATLYEAEKQWINPTYFRRLWNYSYPNRPLIEVHFETGDNKRKLRMNEHPHHERHLENN